MNKPPILLVTMGDPSGIGPEVIIKSFLKNRYLFSSCLPLVVGNHNVLETHFRKFYGGKKSFIKKVSSPAEASRGELCVLDIPGNLLERISYGRTSPEYGRESLLYISHAVKLMKPWKIPALVTAPVSKEAIISSGAAFMGHTEYLAGLTRSSGVAMLMASGIYRALLVTRHIPLKEASGALNRGLIVKQVLIAALALKKYFNITSPGIIMCNFNPHNGEGGRIGKEERDIIAPAAKILGKMGFAVSGPVSAENAFNLRPEILKRSLIVTFYHDQAMVPLKLLCGGGLVNVTCGLPFLRTSPAHGVAFDIAGKNIADPSSMAAAIEMAIGVSS